MIDFACKQFSLKEVIKCALGLSKADLRLMEFFLEHDEDSYDTEKLAKSLSLNLTTIQRGVKRLHEKGVIIRTQRNLEGGGYEYVYRIKDKQVLRDLILSVVQKWTRTVEENLQRW